MYEKWFRIYPGCVSIQFREDLDFEENFEMYNLTKRQN